ncbi:MAG: hypothetical protein ACE5ER_09795 [Nitrospinaceae bacterium]
MEGFLLERAVTVHLKPGGEVCNRLSRGVRVHPVQRKGDWLKINWRSGKKKGWIFHPGSAS